MKKIFCILFFLSVISVSDAQEYFFELNSVATQNTMRKINASDTIVHTAFLPLRVSYANELTLEKFFINGVSETELAMRQNFASKHKPSWVFSKIFADDLITVKDENLTFSLNPMINYYKTRLKDDDFLYWQNTRAFEIHGTLGEKLSFYTDFFESQAYFVPYINDKANYTKVIPGVGAWKDFNEIGKGKDFNGASGYLSYTPFDFLNISFGHSKHFVGNGYRSVLLSDNASSYPFAKFVVTHKKLQYTAMFTEFQDFQGRLYWYHKKRHGTFLLLNYAPFKNVEISLFEAIIWHTSDDSSYVKRFPALYFVPVPLMREAVYGLNNEHNALIGLNFRYGFVKYADFYGQFAIDDWQNTDFNKRFAYQAGFKIYDVFWGKISKQSLFLQAEYNFAKPYTYTSNTTAYVNMNEPLAHPLGAGFTELVGIVAYDFYSFRISAKFNNILTSTDTTQTNFGVDLLKPDDNADFMNTINIVGQGNKTNITLKTLTFAYFVNKKTNLQVFARVTDRNFVSTIEEKDYFFVEFGIRNFVKNFYQDF